MNTLIRTCTALKPSSRRADNSSGIHQHSLCSNSGHWQEFSMVHIEFNINKANAYSSPSLLLPLSSLYACFFSFPFSVRCLTKAIFRSLVKDNEQQQQKTAWTQIQITFGWIHCLFYWPCHVPFAHFFVVSLPLFLYSYRFRWQIRLGLLVRLSKLWICINR